MRSKTGLPTYWQQWIGQFAIRISGPIHDRKPEVVYITHMDRHGDLRGETLNTGVMLFAKPYQLIPYSPRMFRRLMTNCRYVNGRLVMRHNGELLRSKRGP